jgi:hypothetical protein
MAGVVLANPRVKFTLPSGEPAALGWVTVYEAGTTTLSDTWQDKTQTTLNTNPIHLDANGECLIWGDDSKTYKLLLQDSDLATVSGWPVDNLPGTANVAAAAAAAVAAAATYVVEAETARDEAVAAADAALIGAGVYVDEPTGRAAVANGVAFKVQGAGHVAAFEYRRIDASSSSLVATYPAKGYVDDVRATSASFSGSGVYPLATDRNGKVLLGYDEDTDLLVGIPFDASSASASYSINHYLFYGESLSIGTSGGAALSSSQPYSNLKFTGGPAATAATSVALTEVTVETPCSGAANYATSMNIVDGNTAAGHVILASSAGVGGTKIADLDNGTANYTTMLTHVTNGKGLNTSYAVRAMALILGSNDVAAGTSYASYRADVLQFQADMEAAIKAISEQVGTIPLFMSQVSYGAVSATNAMALATLSLAQSSDKFALITPLYHLPYSDGVHLTNVGYKWLGAYFGRAYNQWVESGEMPERLDPVSATLRGSTIRVRFDVPTLPLVLDTSTLAAATNHGFRVVDGGGTVAISSVTVDGSDVVLALGATPSGATTVRYGLDYLGTGLTITGGGSGNLRDSTEDTITISSVSRPLYHVCPHFELTVTTLSE